MPETDPLKAETKAETLRFPSSPDIPDGKEVYDRIMGAIEPELTSTAFPTLETKYASELPGHHEARMKRYEEAISKYKAEYEKYEAQKASEVHTFQRSLMETVERDDRGGDAKAIDTLESQIATL